MSEIKLFAGIRPPSGWMFCEGQILEKSQYPGLFEELKNIYGGDGHTTFALPDFRGRAPVSGGIGPGLSPRRLGQQGGESYVALNIYQMPSHTHELGTIQLSGKFGIMANPNAGNTNNPRNAVLALSEDPVYIEQSAARDTLAGGGSHDVTAIGYVEPLGSKNPTHTNMQPFLAIRYMIRLF